MGEKHSLSTSPKHSILIVDDDAGMVRTTALILKHKGYSVATARNGMEALKKVEEKPFDIIFMDIKMPIMDGLETYHMIQQIRPSAVVVMMTAYALDDLVQQALQDGAYGILYKPLDIEKAVATIEEAKTIEKGALILVVDDDPATCTTLKRILAKRGYQVGIAHTGEQAIAAARTEAYDIVFIDVKLPTINGLETYLAIQETNPEMVAIMMTAYRQEMADLVEEALHSHAYACLYKPFDVELLLRLVNEIWKRKQDAKGEC